MPRTQSKPLCWVWHEEGPHYLTPEQYDAIKQALEATLGEGQVILMQCVWRTQPEILIPHLERFLAELKAEVAKNPPAGGETH